jgi:hypothetical protein
MRNYPSNYLATSPIEMLDVSLLGLSSLVDRSAEH